jgi:DNA anti-recombination protein RmuC
MRNIMMVFFLFLGSLNLYAQDTNTLILNEIKNLRYDMNKRFEQVDKRFEQIDKRFEQVDKHFEQVDKHFGQVEKRFDFLQNILFLLMGLIFTSPFIAIYLKDSRNNENKAEFESIKAILFVLREMAQDDEKLNKTLKAAKLL